jgi:hypothetical protein
MIEQPCEKAETVRRFARNYRNANIDFDRSGVQWLDGFIDWLREKGVDESNGKRSFALGSFLGVCIIETFGGRWVRTECGWKVNLAPSHEIDPYSIIRLHLECGPQYSVLLAFDSILAPARSNDEP